MEAGARQKSSLDSLYADLDVTNPQVDCACRQLAHTFAVNNNAPVQLLFSCPLPSCTETFVSSYLEPAWPCIALPRAEGAGLSYLFVSFRSSAVWLLRPPAALFLVSRQTPTHPFFNPRPSRVESSLVEPKQAPSAGRGIVTAVHETSIQPRCLQLIREHLQSTSQVRS